MVSLLTTAALMDIDRTGRGNTVLHELNWQEFFRTFGSFELFQYKIYWVLSREFELNFSGQKVIQTNMEKIILKLYT